jgi:hypothetical protein
MGILLRVLTAEGENYPSSKRTITFLAFLLVAIGFVTELFFDLKVSPQTYEAMMYIVIGGLGFTASEKFTKKQNGE